MTGTDGMIPGARPYIRVVDSKKPDGSGHDALCDPTPAGKGWPASIAPAAMIGLAGDFIGLVAPASEADPNALLLQFLVGFGSAVGHGPYFTTERDRQTLNLFAVIVGETAGGRKGTGFGHVREIISRSDPTWRQSSGLASGEGIIHAVRDSVQAKDKKGDVATVDEGVADKRLALYEAEFASVLKVASREGCTLSTILRSAWETGHLQTLTRNSPAKATGAHISVVGHITRDELVRLLTTTEAASGFANRHLWALSRRSKILPEGGNLDEAAMAQLAREVSALLIRAREIGELRRDDGARALWRREYERLTSPPAGLLGCMLARGAPQVVRLSAVYALSDPDNQHGMIGTDHLQAALAVWDYCEASCRFIFGDKLGDETADAILSALRATPDGMTRTDVSNLLGRNHTSADIQRALSMLSLRALALKTMEPTTGGRPAERWRAAR